MYETKYKHMTKEQIFIAIVIVLGIVGASFAVIGLTISSIQIMKESIGLGIFIVVFDIILVMFCVWAAIYGIVKPLKELYKK